MAKEDALVAKEDALVAKGGALVAREDALAAEEDVPAGQPRRRTWPPLVTCRRLCLLPDENGWPCHRVCERMQNHDGPCLCENHYEPNNVIEDKAGIS